MSRNSGNIGKRNITSSTVATGKFDTFDQFNARKTSAWPVATSIVSLTKVGGGSTVNEGEDAQFLVIGEGYRQSTTLYATIEGISGFDSSDMRYSTVDTSFVMSSDTQRGNFTFSFALDNVAEGSSNSFVIRIRSGSISGPILFTSSTFTITAPTISLTFSSSSIDEGGSVDLIVTTTNISDGTQINYESFGAWVTSGSVFVYNNSVVNTIYLSSNNTPNDGGTAQFGLIDPYTNSTLATANLTIVDKTPYLSQNTVFFSPSPVNEGQSLTVNGTVNNLPPNTQIDVRLVSNGVLVGVSDLVGPNPTTVSTDGSGNFSTSFAIASDSTTEGPETYSIEVAYNGFVIPNVGSIATVTVNDTSTSGGGGGTRGALSSYTTQNTTYVSSYRYYNFNISADGTRNFIYDNNNYQLQSYPIAFPYNIFTGPFDYDQTYYVGSSAQNFTYSFSATGDRLFIASINGYNSINVNIYSVSNYNISNTNFQGSATIYVNTGPINSLGSFHFSSDGSKMAIGYNSNGNTYIASFSLSTAYRPDFGVSLISDAFSPYMDWAMVDDSYAIMGSGNTIAAYSLSTAFNFSTGSLGDSYTVMFSNFIVQQYRDTSSSTGRIYINTPSTGEIRYLEGNSLSLPSSGGGTLASYNLSGPASSSLSLGDSSRFFGTYVDSTGSNFYLTDSWYQELRRYSVSNFSLPMSVNSYISNTYVPASYDNFSFTYKPDGMKQYRVYYENSYQIKLQHFDNYSSWNLGDSEFGTTYINTNESIQQVGNCAFSSDGTKFVVAYRTMNFTHKFIVLSLYTAWTPTYGWGSASENTGPSHRFAMINDTKFISKISGSSEVFMFELPAAFDFSIGTQLEQVTNVQSAFTLDYYTATGPSSGKIYFRDSSTYYAYDGDNLASTGGGGGAGVQYPVVNFGFIWFGYVPPSSTPYYVDILFNSSSDATAFLSAWVSGKVYTYSDSYYMLKGTITSDTLPPFQNSPVNVRLYYTSTTVSGASDPTSYIQEPGGGGGGATFHRFYYNNDGMVVVEFTDMSARDSFITAIAPDNSFMVSGYRIPVGISQAWSFMSPSMPTTGNYSEGSTQIYYAFFSYAGTPSLIGPSPNGLGSGTYTPL